MNTTQHDKQSLGVRSISKAIDRLWENSANRLSQQELEWFAGFTEAARNDADDLSHIVSGLGCLIGNDKNCGNFRDEGAVMNLLNNLSHQIDTIAGMIALGAFATDRLRHPETYNPDFNQKPEDTAK